MKIQIEIKGELKKYFDSDSFELEFEQEHITIKKLLKQFDLPKHELSYIMFLKNEIKVEKIEKLYDKDQLVIFQPVGGG